MPVQIFCPNPDCGASYSVVDDHLGKLGRCKKCGTEFPLVPHTKFGGPSLPDTDLDSVLKAPEPALPESLGRYKILRLLGRGGMGSVYLAFDTRLKRQVAVKVPHIVAFADRPDVRERFFREAQAAARFHHPNFCPIHDIGEADGVPYLTMAFIDGKTLAASIERDQGWPVRKAVDVARQLAVALAELHRQGIVHRDLKPANIMVDARGSLILMDFGLARWYDDLDSTFTPTGAILGTPAYMPPEQAEGNLKAIGPRSDLYSLGVILYELLTGRRPFEGPITKVLGMIAYAEPLPPSSHRPDLDPALESICLKAMAKKPEDRYGSMDEFAGTLTAFLSEEAVPSSAVSPRPAEEPAPSPPIPADVVVREPTTLRVGEPPVEPRPEPAEESSPRSQPQPQPRSRAPILTRIVAVAAVAALLFGIAYVATDRGRIKIEVNDPAAVVRVDGQEARVEGPGKPITPDIRREDNPASNVVHEPDPPKAAPSGDPPPAVVKVNPPPPPASTAESRKVESPLVDIPKPRETLEAPVEKPSSDPPQPAVVKADPPPPPAKTAESGKGESPLVDIPKPRETLEAPVETAPLAPPKVDQSLITNTLGMKLKLIPAGEFAMGSDVADPDASEDEKVDGEKHRVRITRPFYLGTTEVTVGQFRQFVAAKNFKTEAERDRKGGYGWNEAKAKFTQGPRYTWRAPGFRQEDDHPVVNVSWNDAVAFCEWLSKQEGQTYRLPTEAEWEYACRAGRSTLYSSGDDPELLATVGNTADETAREKYPDWTDTIKARDGFVYTAPVGRFHPNAFGLYDMHGNVWEWCADWYDPEYYSKAPAADPRREFLRRHRPRVSWRGLVQPPAPRTFGVPALVPSGVPVQRSGLSSGPSLVDAIGSFRKRDLLCYRQQATMRRWHPTPEAARTLIDARQDPLPLTPSATLPYSVVDENLGKLGRCKKCGTKFPLVPHTGEKLRSLSETERRARPLNRRSWGCPRRLAITISSGRLARVGWERSTSPSTPSSSAGWP